MVKVYTVNKHICLTFHFISLQTHLGTSMFVCFLYIFMLLLRVHITRWKSGSENGRPVDNPVLYDNLIKVTWNEWPRLIRAQTDCCTCGIYRRGTKDVISLWAVSRSTRLMWSKAVIQPHRTWDLLVHRCLDWCGCNFAVSLINTS